MKLGAEGFFAIINTLFFAIIRLTKFVVRARPAGGIPVPIPSKDLTLELRLPAIPQGTERPRKDFERTFQSPRVSI